MLLLDVAAVKRQVQDLSELDATSMSSFVQAKCEHENPPGQEHESHLGVLRGARSHAWAVSSFLFCPHRLSKHQTLTLKQGCAIRSLEDRIGRFDRTVL